MEELPLDEKIMTKGIELMALTALFYRDVKAAKEKLQEVNLPGKIKPEQAAEAFFISQLTGSIYAIMCSPYFQKHGETEKDKVVLQLPPLLEKVEAIRAIPGGYAMDNWLGAYKECIYPIIRLFRVKLYRIICEKFNDLGKVGDFLTDVLLKMGIRIDPENPGHDQKEVEPGIELNFEDLVNLDFSNTDMVDLEFEDPVLNELKLTIAALDSMLLVQGLKYWEARLPIG